MIVMFGLRNVPFGGNDKNSTFRSNDVNFSSVKFAERLAGNNVRSSANRRSASRDIQNAVHHADQRIDVMRDEQDRRAGRGFDIGDAFDHPCLVSKEALFELSRQDPNLDMLKAYKAYESKIQGIARRLVTAGVPGSPLVLQSKHF